MDSGKQSPDDREAAAMKREWTPPTLTILTFSQTSFGGNGLFQDSFIPPYTYGSQFSDARLKRDIAPVERLANGLKLYRYRYLWSEIEYVGVMAQDVAVVRPDAVTAGPGGYLRVDYARLGLRLMTWAEWSRTRAAEGTARAA